MIMIPNKDLIGLHQMMDEPQLQAAYEKVIMDVAGKYKGAVSCDCIEVAYNAIVDYINETSPSIEAELSAYRERVDALEEERSKYMNFANSIQALKAERDKYKDIVDSMQGLFEKLTN
jgi:uncharacterized coiled-coil DUF342 family protein